MIANIAYTSGENSHPRHRLDIYPPEGVDNFPCLMFVSGGGWSSGSKDWIAPVGTTLAAQGIGVITVDHRLAPEVTYSQQVEDLAHAFAWIKKNIVTYGGDPARLIIGGHSAGGHLISLLAMDRRYLEAPGYHSGDISGVILVSAVLDVGDRFAESGGGEAASPLNHVRAGLPPFLLLSASDDLPDLPEQAQVMARALRAEGVLVERVVIDNRDHFNIIHHIGSPGDVTTQTMYGWIMTTTKLIQQTRREVEKATAKD
jgi:acetyl esterase/lipase